MKTAKVLNESPNSTLPPPRPRSDGAAFGEEEGKEEVPWWRVGKEGRGSGRGVGGGGEGPSSGSGAFGAGQGSAEEVWYRRSASTMEAFVQTSTVGEFEARLQLLASFCAHLQVGAGEGGGGCVVVVCVCVSIYILHLSCKLIFACSRIRKLCWLGCKSKPLPLTSTLVPSPTSPTLSLPPLYPGPAAHALLPPCHPKPHHRRRHRHRPCCHRHHHRRRPGQHCRSRAGALPAAGCGAGQHVLVLRPVCASGARVDRCQHGAP